ncbi:MAG: metal ABC transporter ATP-binding protein [Anaerolineae bacterium]|nr:metal ABC transporter ATP-binding protein [Anaerolineae bacterium]
MAAVQAEPRTSSTTQSPQAKEPTLIVRDLTVQYGDVLALESVSFTIARGECVAVIGSNGAGKSTLLKAILGLIRTERGTVTVHADHPLPLGYVPQHEGIRLDFPVTVEDVVMMGRIRQIGWLRVPGRRDWKAVEEAMARTGIIDLRHRQIGELSGGQRRRAFIARALAQEAECLLLDEPMSGVDAAAQSDLIDTLHQLSREGMTVVMTTHDLDLAFRRFDRVMALRRRLIAFGTPREVYRADVLAQVYNRAVTTWGNNGEITMLVDEHGCGDC